MNMNRLQGIRNIYLGFLMIFLSICLLFPSLAQSQSESEPNNSQEQANEIRLGQSIQGLFQPKDDEDWYKLVNSQSGRNIIRIDLTGVAGVNSYLEIYNEKEEKLKESDTGDDGEAEAIINFGVTEGIYYIMVSGFQRNEKDKYTLSTKLLSPWQEGQEFELNDELEQANEIKLGQSIEGYFQPKGDKDWYKFVVSQSGKNIIRIDLTGVAGVNSYIEIYNEKGERLKESDTGGDGEGEAIINFGVTEGIYYIKVNGRQENGKDKYLLSTKLLGPWQKGQEFEPNDELEQANKIKLGKTIKGSPYPDTDKDWYVFTMPEPGLEILVIELSGLGGVDLLLELLDADGQELKEANNGEMGEKETIVRMKVKPGKYYIMVNNYGSNTETAYSLRAGKPTVPPATPEEVNKALTKALDGLARTQTKDGDWSSSESAIGISGLASMAFLGADCIQKDYTPNIKAAVNFLKSKYQPSSNYKSGSKEKAYYGGLIASAYDIMYEHAISTLALIEALVNLNDYSLEPITEDALQLIIRAQNTEHKPVVLGGPVNSDSNDYGGWRYKPDSTDSDISVSGWQILALKGALSAGFEIPEWSLPKAATFLRACYDKDEKSFTYQAGDREIGCARTGIGALGLQLCGFPDDPLIKPALRFMQNNPPVWVVEDPGAGWPFYYWYYGTRAMLMAGGDDWRIWKTWMCRLLVDNQNDDGAWESDQKEAGMGIYTTSLGALMLEFCCGHVPIYMQEKIQRPGLVEVAFGEGAKKQAAKNVELILDASNSMWGQIKGEGKISIAKKVLSQIINGLPDEMNVGLRLYGHRYPLKDKRACKDTELVVPIGPLAKSQLITTINSITPKGKTPLVFSVLEAGKDFEKINRGSIILITDGIESCNGDINSIAPAFKKLGIGLKVHIVGFDIKEAEAKQQLEAIAKSTDGVYLDAKDSQQLLSSLQQTLQIEYIILDEKGAIKAKGFVDGEPVRVMEGTYKLRLILEPQPLEVNITVKPGQKSLLLLKKENEKWTINEK